MENQTTYDPKNNLNGSGFRMGFDPSYVPFNIPAPELDNLKLLRDLGFIIRTTSETVTQSNVEEEIFQGALTEASHLAKLVSRFRNDLHIPEQYDSESSFAQALTQQYFDHLLSPTDGE